HDSRPLTAYDVAYTFQSILDPQLRAPSRKSFEPIDKIQVLDSLTIKFKLKYPYAPFLANTQVGIVPRHIAQNKSNMLQRRPMGSGPFIFKKWKADSYVELSANTTYWKSPPKLDGVLVEILPEETTRILALENGEIDFLMNNFPESFLPRFRKNPDLKVEMKTGSNYVYLGLNLRNPFLKNRKVRQAIAHAIDVKGIINNLMGGIHVPAKSLLNPRHWAYNPNLPDYAFDPEMAKQLLDEAGYPDPDGDGPEVRFTLSYKCTDKQMSRQKAQLIQEYLKQVGIGIDIQSYEWGTFFEDVQSGRFDMYSLTWVGIYEPDIYYQIFHSDNIGIGANRGGYSNPRVDELIEKA
ncbi:MAG: ABC transporter substrate-binding protein, partial [Calditrichia bacterium]